MTTQVWRNLSAEGRLGSPHFAGCVDPHGYAGNRSDAGRCRCDGPGDPDLPTPPHIVEAAKIALDRGATHYTHPAGDPALRRAMSEHIARVSGVEYDPETEIIVTLGAQEAVYLAMLTLLEEGDEALLASHRFTSYDMAVELAGRPRRAILSDRRRLRLDAGDGRHGADAAFEVAGDRLARQPDWRRRRPGPDRRLRAIGVRTRFARDFRRDLQSVHLRRWNPRQHRGPTGDAPAHAYRQWPLQVLRDDRLARRLFGGSGRLRPRHFGSQTHAVDLHSDHLPNGGGARRLDRPARLHRGDARHLRRPARR